MSASFTTRGFFVVNPNGTPTGRKVLVPLQKTDSFFTVALVETL